MGRVFSHKHIKWPQPAFVLTRLQQLLGNHHSKAIPLVFFILFNILEFPFQVLYFIFRPLGKR